MINLIELGFTVTEDTREPILIFWDFLIRAESPICRRSLLDTNLHRLHRFRPQLALIPGRSFPDDLNDQLPIPRAVVKIDEDDLLPCPKLHPATDKRHSETRTEQRCPYVGVPVAITPSQIVCILDVLRRNPLKHTLEIGDQASPRTRSSSRHLLRQERIQ